jgi:hypothetical protein
MSNLLTREEFKKQVFSKTNGKCCVPNCNCDAVDAHHIMDRKLFTNGGYYLANGAALCAKHHLDAEKGTITPLECLHYMKLTFGEYPIPDKIGLTKEEYLELFCNGKLNKWGE